MRFIELLKKEGPHSGSLQKGKVCCLSRGLPTIWGVFHLQPSVKRHFLATTSSNSSALNLMMAYFLEMWLLWWPGNWDLALCRASVTFSLLSMVAMDMITCPVWTLTICPGAS